MVLYSVVYRVCMKSMYTGHVYRANINYIHKVHELSGVRIHRKALASREGHIFAQKYGDPGPWQTRTPAGPSQ